MERQMQAGIAMRFVALVLMLSSCWGGSLGTGVTPLLSELPAEKERRDAILDSSHEEPAPETKTARPLGKKERKAVGVAATAAAIVGAMFSKTQNVTIGVNQPLGGGGIDHGPAKNEKKEKKAPLLNPDGTPAVVTVPWIPLGPAK